MDDININKQLQQQWPAYKAALRHDVHIVSTETCAIICAMLLVWGKHEEFTRNPRLLCELTYAQQRFMLPGGEVKDELFKRALSYYIVIAVLLSFMLFFMKNLLIIILFALPIPSTAQTKTEVMAELKRQGVPHAGIVLAQARLETGNFKSDLCRKHHNLFGIKHGRSYAHYTTWQQSVADYKKRISSRYKGGDYYAFLQRIGYAQDGKYIGKLKSF